MTTNYNMNCMSMKYGNMTYTNLDLIFKVAMIQIIHNIKVTLQATPADTFSLKCTCVLQ